MATAEAAVVVPRKRFVGVRQASGRDGRGLGVGREGGEAGSSSSSNSRVRPSPINSIPEEILGDAALNKAITRLPANYDFEIHKTVWQIRTNRYKRVALQMPEGLLIFATTIADILEEFCHVSTLILSDVTYGACCIDDYSARSLGADFIVHYGHSCLVPISTTVIKTLYVFVTIGIDLVHLLESVQTNFIPGTRMAVVGTVQFLGAVHHIKARLGTRQDMDQEAIFEITIPQIKPLSPGEILGCTSPKLKDQDCILYIGDGRFHLESIMIANPGVPAYQYNPYDKRLTREYYSHHEMLRARDESIRVARNAKRFGLIQGTLGRQGSPKVLSSLQARLRAKGKDFMVILLSEIYPSKLDAFEDIDAWIQTSCPRLSTDWGYAFSKPLLSPYEAAVVLDETAWTVPNHISAKDERATTSVPCPTCTTPTSAVEVSAASNDVVLYTKSYPLAPRPGQGAERRHEDDDGNYPMDFYAHDSRGDWTPNHGQGRRSRATVGGLVPGRAVAVVT